MFVIKYWAKMLQVSMSRKCLDKKIIKIYGRGFRSIRLSYSQKQSQRMCRPIGSVDGNDFAIISAKNTSSPSASHVLCFGTSRAWFVPLLFLFSVNLPPFYWFRLLFLFVFSRFIKAFFNYFLSFPLFF